MTSPVNAADLELTHTSGVIVPLVLETVRDSRGNALPRSIKSALSAAVADSPLADWLESYVQESWIGGCGGGGAKLGYTQAPGVVARIGDTEQSFAFPGPAEFPASVPDAGFQSATRICAIEEYLNNLYFVQVGTSTANVPRVMVSPSGGASLSDSLGGAAGGIAAGNALTGATVFRDRSTSATARYLYVSGVDGSGARLHRFDGATWTSTASNLYSASFGSNIRFDWLQKVFWRTANGDQGWRMVAGDQVKSLISYTKPNADPMLAASWVLGAIQVDTTGTIRLPPFIRRHLYAPAVDGVYDIDELGDTPNIVSDMDHHRHPLNGYASVYADDYIYLTLGQGGVGRVYVGEQGLLQATIGQCGPGAFTGAEHEYGGFATCFTIDQGWIPTAMFNPNNGYAGIWWGRDRKYYPEVETANPMIWHGPEIHSTANYFVTAMRTFTDLTAETLHLWIAFNPFSAGASDFVGGNPKVSYFTLPIAGQPLSDFLTGGNNLFAVGSNPGGDWQPTVYLTSLPYSWLDKGSKKHMNDITIGSRGLSAANGTTMNIFTRADPNPGDTSFGSGTGINTSPTQSFIPATVTSGNKTQYRIDLLSPHGADASAGTRAVGVLDAVRQTAFRIAPTVRVLDLTVTLGKGIRDIEGGTDETKSVDDLRTLIADMAAGGRTTLRIRPDERYTVKVRQVMDEDLALIGNDQRATIRLQVGIIERLS